MTNQIKRAEFKVCFFDSVVWSIIMWMIGSIFAVGGAISLCYFAFIALGWVGIHFTASWFFIAPIAVSVWFSYKLFKGLIHENPQAEYDMMIALGYKSTREFYKDMGC